MKAQVYALTLSLAVLSMPLHSAGKPQDVSSLNKSSPTNQAKIDLNKADADTLAHSINGIGQKRAQAIVKYRETHGKFSKIQDLAKVKGIGEQFVKNHLSKLQSLFTVG